MSHQTSRMLVMASAATSVPMNSSNSAQPDSWYGSPAVGRFSKTLDRHDAIPVSWASQNGLEADRARKWGM